MTSKEICDAIQKYCSGYMSKDGNYKVQYDLKSLLPYRDDKDLKDVARYLYKQHNSAISLETTLSQLVYRFMNPQLYVLPHVEYLQGPISFRKFTSPTLPHIIYIFGDLHVSKSTCPKERTISNFIANYTQKSTVFVDIFIEYEYIYKNKRDELLNDNYLSDLISSFPKECLSILKTNCNMKTSRIHYTDIRRYSETPEDHKLFMLIGIVATNNIREPKIMEYALKSFVKNEDFLLKHLSTRKGIYDYLTSGMRYKRILKQIAAIPSPTMRDILTKYLHHTISDHISELVIPSLGQIITLSKKLYKHSRDDRMTQTKYTNQLEVFAAYAKKLVGGVYLPLMDVYLIARLLRTFTTTNNVIRKYSEPAYNSFIYAGNKHARNYSTILKSLGFVEDIHITNDYDSKNFHPIIGKPYQCLNFKSIEQPLFGERIEK